RRADVAGRGDDRPLEPVGIGAAKFFHVPVIGADESHLERNVRHTDDAGPHRRHQEMDVGAFLVHVEHTVVGTVVDDAEAWPPFAAPDAAIARAGAYLGVAQRALVESLFETVGGPLAAIEGARLDLGLVGRKVVEPGAERGIDVFLQHVGAGIDMRVRVADAKSVAHRSSPHAPPEACRPRPNGATTAIDDTWPRA